MTNQERAEKIANEIVLESRQDRFSKATVWEIHLIVFITSQLDEAVREALEENCKCVMQGDDDIDGSQCRRHNADFFEKGFASAREKFGDLVEKYWGAIEGKSELLERIRAMEAGK